MKLTKRKLSPTGKELTEVPVTVRMPRGDWLFLETVLVMVEISQTPKDKRLHQNIAERIQTIKLAIIRAERKKAQELYK